MSQNKSLSKVIANTNKLVPPHEFNKDTSVESMSDRYSGDIPLNFFDSIHQAQTLQVPVPVHFGQMAHDNALTPSSSTFSVDSSMLDGRATSATSFLQRATNTLKISPKFIKNCCCCCMDVFDE